MDLEHRLEQTKLWAAMTKVRSMDQDPGFVEKMQVWLPDLWMVWMVIKRLTKRICDSLIEQLTRAQ